VIGRCLQRYLRTGGVIAYPTESVFGLGCDPANRRAVQRVLKIKGRPQRKGLILIASDLAQLAPYIAPLTPEQQARLGESSQKKPYTWVVPRAADCPRWLTGQHRSVAVRLTAHRLSRRLCLESGTALVSTSANRSGGRPSKTTRDCLRRFGAQTRVIPGRTGGAKRPSTIADLLTGRILRK
jgi:L-threonylcarbamoyladenylate synthase